MNQYFGIDLAKNFVKDIVKIRFLSNSNLEPLILAYFITFRCNLNCSYCNYIQQRFELKYKEVNTQQAKLILHQCRKKVPSVAFTGGEPLIRDDIVEIIQFAKELRFKPISLFTNGLLLQQKEAVLENIDFIQISLDSVIEQKNHGNRDREKLIEIIQKYSKLQYKKNFKININCVINSENIEEIPELLNFAKQLNVKLTVCPELNEMAEPVDELKNGESGKKYRQMIDYLLEQKKENNVLMDIKPFLENIKTFKNYQCFPQSSLRIYPDGRIIYPCPNINVSQLNILQENFWQRFKNLKNNDSNECKKSCFLPCYLESSLILKHPLLLFKEFL